MIQLLDQAMSALGPGHKSFLFPAVLSLLLAATDAATAHSVHGPLRTSARNVAGSLFLNGRELCSVRHYAPKSNPAALIHGRPILAAASYDLNSRDSAKKLLFLARSYQIKTCATFAPANASLLRKASSKTGRMTDKVTFFGVLLCPDLACSHEDAYPWDIGNSSACFQSVHSAAFADSVALICSFMQTLWSHGSRITLGKSPSSSPPYSTVSNRLRRVQHRSDLPSSADCTQKQSQARDLTVVTVIQQAGY